ncbi:hypothetical protein H0H93_006549 [Arthromyces matolae]|nr:hypothetical protein H0H93_006549 [Arthromyces matolae]
MDHICQIKLLIQIFAWANKSKQKYHAVTSACHKQVHKRRLACVVSSTTGGEANWNQHLQRNAHRKNLATAPSSKSTITNFFSKSKGPSGFISTSITPPPLLKAVTLPDGISATTLSSNCGDELPFADFSPAEDQKRAHLAIMRIFRLAKELPLLIPLGTVDDQWAGFTGDISSEVLQYDDDISMLVNHSLHRVFDYQMTAEELSNSIRRGPLGVEAFCNWALKCMAEFEVSGGLLEPRLELLEQALKNMYYPDFLDHFLMLK